MDQQMEADADRALGAWEMPEEFEMLRTTARRFMKDEVLPREERLEHDAYAFPDGELSELQRRAREIGLWCVQTPAEYGGAGLNLLAQCVVAEESSQCRMGAYIPAGGAFGFDPPNVIFKGTSDQIEKYARPIIEGGGKTFVAISEPSGGSDPARSIQTRAVRDGNHYVLNGTKVWISGASQAEWGIVYARTGSEKARGNITAFIVERDTPGLTQTRIPVIRSYSPYELTFEDVRVPIENRLGEEGEGFKLAEEWLVHGRVPYAAATLGIAEASLRMAIEWAKDRYLFKSALAEKQAVQWMIADSEIELRAAKLMVYQAAWRADLGRDIKVDASMAKVLATETAGRIVDRCIQIHGGMGVACEMPLERWYREMRIKRIGEGPSEVHRMVVARDILGSPNRRSSAA
ncbi:alkylation response protein AidB-like acyl-CoA dehydrogenase [Palleronia aestuarii]|uniref:Medium-chain specific acyl-CoA dehydrogenase, mitochondrial n=1 Tax=Palleronia aestuarii TaxID=568105 RepID=A0A2W7NIL8_9RHOB|nr:acyl-CoA dehydrogenase family protein [Palleronia aestuarii]PZX13026.1 alkylation response protein AidB-like acyl-CoA dehydrogenase [Palleronia aestuarii]